MIHPLTLVIGNKNYSSWSLRPWILLKYFKIPFEEVLIPLYEGNYKAEILKYSPYGKVPILVHGPVKVWESLAICQYLAEAFPQHKMWPQKIEEKAWAYSISQEMHAGFVKLRTHMPMNIRSTHAGKGKTPDVERDITRIIEIWTSCRQEFQSKGPFLFGPFTIADAMFVPVVTRFKTYGISLEGLAADYSNAIQSLPAFQEWKEKSIQEPWFVQASEIYSVNA